MKIERMFLRSYKPMLHQPIKEIEAKFNSILQIIIGQNGSGKSSLLHELFPFPPTSSIFEKDGKKRIEITHNDNAYVIESDFSDKQHPHSFSKNGEELNTSGANKIQFELCADEFGLTPTIGKVLSMQTTLTTLTPGNRQSLLFELYPGNLSFLENKYKFIRKRATAFENQLKPLTNMEREKKDRVLSEDVLKQYQREYEELTEQMNMVDKTIFLLEKEIDEINSKLQNNIIQNDRKFSLDQVHDKLYWINSILCNLKINHPGLFTYKDPKLALGSISQHFDSLEESLDEQEKNAEELKKTINECSALYESSVSDEIKRLENEKTQIEKKMQHCYVDSLIPVVNEEEIEKLKESTKPWMEKIIDDIEGFECSIWSRDRIDRCHRTINAIKSDLLDLENERKHIRDDNERCNEEYNKRKETFPPEDCKRECKLKETFQHFVNDLIVKLKQSNKKWDHLNKRIDTEQCRLERLQKAVYGPEQLVSYVDQIFDMIEWRNWGKYLFNYQDPVYVLNHNRTIIVGNLNKLITNSENSINKKQLQDKLEKITERLKTLKETNLPAEEFVNKTLVSRKTELNKTLERITELKDQISRINSVKSDAETLSQKYDEVNSLQSKFNSYKNELVLEHLKEYDQDITDKLYKLKEDLNNRLREKTNVLREQKDINSELKNTIYPRKRKIENLLRKVRYISPELSPKSGIPYQYMLKFVNGVLSNMNEIIRDVWGYNLEMEYEDGNVALDYCFPVRINDGNKVQDCSMCSKGEKEILDIAWLFAVYRVLGFNHCFPVFLDEPDSALSHGNRLRIMELIKNLITSGDVHQLFIVNHNFSLFSAFEHNEIMCLNPSNIVLPEVYNTHVKIA